MQENRATLVANIRYIFLPVYAQLGISMAKEKKTVELTTRLTFIGIELDILVMQMRLPKNKLGSSY